MLLNVVQIQTYHICRKNLLRVLCGSTSLSWCHDSGHWGFFKRWTVSDSGKPLPSLLRAFRGEKNKLLCRHAGAHESLLVQCLLAWRQHCAMSHAPLTAFRSSKSAMDSRNILWCIEMEPEMVQRPRQQKVSGNVWWTKSLWAGLGISQSPCRRSVGCTYTG